MTKCARASPFREVGEDVNLFSRATPDNEEFLRVLDRYYAGTEDLSTLATLREQGNQESPGYTVDTP